ncbi:MAG: hypothetical protein ACXAE3_10500, partial [Candidatus Kariarchaeaceae archaeon]
MADLSKYPNPLRLFTQSRDEWFTSQVASLGIPMHIFSAVRDTQLGQLMYAIETVRMKRKRAGEDPGPGLLEGENASMFVPLFGIVKQFQDLLDHEDIELDKSELYSQLLSDNLLSDLDPIKKKGQDWFTPLSLERLDELNGVLDKITEEGFITPLASAMGTEPADLKEKLSELNQSLADSLFSFHNHQISTAITSNSFTEDEADPQTRIFSIDGEELPLTFNEYHGRINLHYGFIEELKRLVSDPENYNFDFPLLEPLLSLEMLIMFPVPDSSRLALIKQHLALLSDSIPKSFINVLSTAYQTFSRIEDANPKMVRKLYSSLEKTMKDECRKFWKEVNSTDAEAEVLIAIIWSHLRAIQTQAQYREQQMGHDHNHSQTHAVTIRLEHIFWVQGRDYYTRDSHDTPIQFWSHYAAIANRQVRKSEDSLELFYQLDELLDATG